MIWLLAALMQLTPVVQNHTSIQLVGVEVTEYAVVLHLKNTSPQAIVGITATHGDSHEQSELASQPSQKTQPEALFDFKIGMTQEQMEDQGRIIVIRALLFDDLSGNGDAPWIEALQASIAGAQHASRVMLKLLTEESRPGMLLSNVEFSEGTIGDGDSVSVPPEFKSKRASFEFNSGYLGVKETVLRVLKAKQEKGPANVRQDFFSGMSVDDLKTQLEKTLLLGRIK